MMRIPANSGHPSGRYRTPTTIARITATLRSALTSPHLRAAFAGKYKFYWMSLALLCGLLVAFSHMNARQNVQIQISRAEFAIETARKNVNSQARFRAATELLKLAKKALEDRRYDEAKHSAVAAMREAQESTERRSGDLHE